MALTNLALFGGAFCTPIVVGKMTHTIGWWWTFYFVAIFAGACLPAVIFYVPETAYRRSNHLNTDYSTTDDRHFKFAGQELSTVNPERTNGVHSSNGSLDKQSVSPSVQGFKEARINPPPPKVSYARTLLPFNGRKTDESYFKLLLRPFPLFFHPSILWACLIQGTLIGWTVFLGIVLAAIMLGPPLWFDEVKTGYMYTGAFIGAIIGYALSGLMADWSQRWLTRKNKGIYEPEFRMILVIPQMIFGCAGLYGFGICADNAQKYGWFWPAFFFALVVLGMVCGAVASALYVVDAHRKFFYSLSPCVKSMCANSWCRRDCY